MVMGQMVDDGLLRLLHSRPAFNHRMQCECKSAWSMMIVKAGELAKKSASSSAFPRGANTVWDRNIGKLWVHHGMKFLSNYFATL